MKSFKFENVSEGKIIAVMHELRRNGGFFSTSTGYFHSPNGISGFMNRVGTDIEVRITKKPWLLSWGIIEYSLKDIFKP